jgi:hypothetical protein
MARIKDFTTPEQRRQMHDLARQVERAQRSTRKSR